jgi:hypothetical protein
MDDISFSGIVNLFGKQFKHLYLPNIKDVKLLNCNASTVAAFPIRDVEKEYLIQLSKNFNQIILEHGIGIISEEYTTFVP